VFDAGHGSYQLGGAVLYCDNISIGDAKAEIECCHRVLNMFSLLGEAQHQGAGSGCKVISA
jgi:hypothetical protein